LNLVINYEEGAERNPLDGDEVLEPLSEASYTVPPGQRELALESFYEYGSRVGIWRLLSLLDRYEVRATVFACGRAILRNPDVARALVVRKYDIVGHGYRWIPHSGLSEEEEREQIRKARDSIQQSTGQRIIGWFTRPLQTVATRRILAEEGFLFDSGAFNDDIPYFQEIRGRPFLVLPYTLDVNDIRFWKTGLFIADDFASYCINSFEVLYQEGASIPRMMSVGLHPRVIGRPGRIVGLDRFLTHIRKCPEVWIAARTDIARFWAERFAPSDTWNWPQ
jgi:peptidoglycan/xylan/chitin deacetylase (PgdA/CDA1 family)